MINSLRVVGLVFVVTALTACGGGSSNSSGTSSTASNTTSASNNSTATSTDVITKKCVTENNVVQVTSDGCTAFVGNNDQTILCTSTGNRKTIKMLSGTNITRESLTKSEGGFTGGGNITFNNTSLSCV